MKRIFSLLFLLIFISFSSNKVLDPLTLQEMYRLKENALSIDKKYLVYSVTKWSNDQKKSFTNLRYFNLETKEEKLLTEEIYGQSDTFPVFSSKFKNILFFMRNNDNFVNTLFYMKFPPEENKNEEPIQLSNYPITIDTFKIKNDILVFSAEVYFECQTISCTVERNEKEKNLGYKTYNNLFAFHWDHWLTEGKGSHLFYQKLVYNEEEGKFNDLETEPKDITLNMTINTPPLFTDNSMYDISNNGTRVAFTAHERNENESLSTGYNIYLFDNESDSVESITGIRNDSLIGSRTLNPKFSNDDNYISYLAMKTKGLESEFKHFEFYDFKNDSIIYFEDKIDVSPNDYLWINDSCIIYQADYFGTTKLFSFNFSNLNESDLSYDYQKIKVRKEFSSYSLPIYYLNENGELQLIVKETAFNQSITINLLNETDYVELVNLNQEITKDIIFPEHESFTYKSNDDDIQGWFIPPVNLNIDKSYPLVVFIHGGPEQSWTSTFSFYWNPQIFAAQGYASILLNVHGSTGVTSDFQNSVRSNWGGKPFEDIKNGVKYILEKYEYIDDDKIVAMGGSYGGYMINWIEGHNDDEKFKFKCLVNHDGIFYNLGMFYETDELWFVKAELCPLDNIECNPYEDGMREKIKEYSPESHVDKWETPMLIIHGNNDYRVSLTQGLSTFTALRLKKVDAKLIYYPLENHWVVSNVANQVVWLQEIINWFKKYAPPEEEDSSSSESSEIESSSESSKSRSRSSDSSKSRSSSSERSKRRSSSSDSSESSKIRSSSSSDSDDSNSSKDDDGTNILTIVLIILAILFLLLLAVFCIFRYRKKIRNDDLEKDVNKADLIM